MVIRPIELIPEIATMLNTPCVRVRKDVIAIKIVSNPDVNMKPPIT